MKQIPLPTYEALDIGTQPIPYLCSIRLRDLCAPLRRQEGLRRLPEGIHQHQGRPRGDGARQVGLTPLPHLIDMMTCRPSSELATIIAIKHLNMAFVQSRYV